jgi:hypothetical protein
MREQVLMKNKSALQPDTRIENDFLLKSFVQLLDFSLQHPSPWEAL